MPGEHLDIMDHSGLDPCRGPKDVCSVTVKNCKARDATFTASVHRLLRDRVCRKDGKQSDPTIVP